MGRLWGLEIRGFACVFVSWFAVAALSSRLSALHLLKACPRAVISNRKVQCSVCLTKYSRRYPNYRGPRD